VKREHHRWFSPSLGRDMDLLVFGHGGTRVLVFPTSLAPFFEWEDRGMIATMAEPIRRGWFQFFCVASVDHESWYARPLHPASAAQRQSQFEQYVRTEVLPLSEHTNPNPFLIVTGASFGAYHAVDFAFRHPHLVGRVVAMSGMYDIKRLTGGQGDGEVYVHDPSHYMVNERDPARLEAIRHIDIILAIGRDDPNRADNEHLSGVLWSKGIWHALRLWDGWAHDWPWWRQMLPLYIGGHD
jgi:esterase/lipase superfamily enzyme